MARAHFILQGRGGVGKTLVAVMLAQALSSMGRAPINIDTAYPGRRSLVDGREGARAHFHSPVFGAKARVCREHSNKRLRRGPDRES